MFQLYDVVALKHDDSQHGVRKGQKGTIIDVLANGEAYTVEFVDDKGVTIEQALFTEYEEKDLELQ